MGRKRLDPLTRLENQDARQRNDLLNAARFVVKQLSGEELRLFAAEATALFRRFLPKEEDAPKNASLPEEAQ